MKIYHNRVTSSLLTMQIFPFSLRSQRTRRQYGFFPPPFLPFCIIRNCYKAVIASFLNNPRAAKMRQVTCVLEGSSGQVQSEKTGFLAQSALSSFCGVLLCGEVMETACVKSAATCSTSHRLPVLWWCRTHQITLLILAEYNDVPHRGALCDRCCSTVLGLYEHPENIIAQAPVVNLVSWWRSVTGPPPCASYCWMRCHDAAWNCAFAS